MPQTTDEPNLDHEPTPAERAAFQKRSEAFLSNPHPERETPEAAPMPLPVASRAVFGKLTPKTKLAERRIEQVTGYGPERRGSFPGAGR